MKRREKKKKQQKEADSGNSAVQLAGSDSIEDVPDLPQSDLDQSGAEQVCLFVPSPRKF